MSVDELGERSGNEYTLPYERAMNFLADAVLELRVEGGRGSEAGPPEHGIEGLDWSKGGRYIGWSGGESRANEGSQVVGSLSTISVVFRSGKKAAHLVRRTILEEIEGRNHIIWIE